MALKVDPLSVRSTVHNGLSECYNWAEGRRRLAMSNGRLRLEPSDAGSCFRVGNTKGWISDVDGESAFKMATVFLDLERAHGA